MAVSVTMTGGVPHRKLGISVLNNKRQALEKLSFFFFFLVVVLLFYLFIF